MHDAAGHACGLPEDFTTAAKKEVSQEAQFRVSYCAGATLLGLVAEGREEVRALQQQAHVRSCASVGSA